MDETDIAATLKTLSARMDELSNAISERKGMANISGAFNDGKGKVAEKIKESPFAYLGGAFIGGLALGYMMSRSRKD